MTAFYTNALIRGNHILLRGVDDNGKSFNREVKYKPFLFVPTKDKDAEFHSIHGQPLKQLEFETIREAKQFWFENREVSNAQVFGMTNYEYPFLYERWTGTVDFDVKKIKIATVDIECEVIKGFPDIQLAENMITAITIGFRGFKIALGLDDYKPTGSHIRYYKFTDEYALLQGFLEIWGKIMPDVMTGWNIEFFDVPYLINRITKVCGENAAKRLSPWNIIETKMVEIRGKKQQAGKIGGIALLDYQQLYQKFNEKKQERYSLDFISGEELGESKLDYGEYGSLENLRLNNHQKYIEYNIHDVDLVERLEAKKKFLELVFTVAYWAKINYEDVFSPVKTWDVIIHNHLFERKIAVSPFKDQTSCGMIEGAYVRPPQIKKHRWVMGLDLDSLYPHLMMMYNISPETMVDMLKLKIDIDGILDGKLAPIMGELKANNLAVAANLALFSKDKQGFLPFLMKWMYDERKKFKGQLFDAEQKFVDTKDQKYQYEADRLHNLQWSLKILLNSCYGALLNEYFRWYSRELGEAITLSGQLAIRWVFDRLNAYLNKILKTNNVDYIIAGDTDSCYINLEVLVNTFETKDEQKIVDKLVLFANAIIQPFLKKIFQELAESMNAYEQSMNMKLDTISNMGIWTAKKNYALNVWQAEKVRYKEPKLKITGLASAKSSTPKVAREALKHAIALVMKEDQVGLHQFVQQFREEFNGMTFNDVACPSGVKGLNKYRDHANIYIKGTPIHVKGSLIYNNLLRNKNVVGYEEIVNNEKIRYSYIKKPNPYNIEVIAVNGDLPYEFGLHEYVDYDRQFEKVFLSPLNIVLDVIGWTAEKKQTLEAFFQDE